MRRPPNQVIQSYVLKATLIIANSDWEKRIVSLTCNSPNFGLQIGDRESLWFLFLRPSVNGYMHQVVHYHISKFLSEIWKSRRTEILRLRRNPDVNMRNSWLITKDWFADIAARSAFKRWNSRPSVETFRATLSWETQNSNFWYFNADPWSTDPEDLGSSPCRVAAFSSSSFLNRSQKIMFLRFWWAMSMLIVLYLRWTKKDLLCRICCILRLNIV